MVDGVAHTIEVLDTAGQVIMEYSFDYEFTGFVVFKDKMILYDLLI